MGSNCPTAVDLSYFESQRKMATRTFAPSEERGLTVEQKNYLKAHPYMVSLQPHSMLLPREQLYKTLSHGAVTIDQAMALDAHHVGLPGKQAKETAVDMVYDNYSNAEDSFIDRHGMSSGLY